MLREYNGAIYKVSDWANFIATDDSGRVYEYEKEPILHEGATVWTTSVGRVNRLYPVSDPDWEKSLRKVEDLPIVVTTQEEQP